MKSPLFLLDEWLKHPVLQAQLGTSTLLPSYVRGQLYRMPTGAVVIGTRLDGKIYGKLLASPAPRLLSILQAIVMTGEIYASETTITAHIENQPVQALTWACRAPENHGGVPLNTPKNGA